MPKRPARSTTAADAASRVPAAPGGQAAGTDPRRAGADASSSPIDPADRHRRIAEAAYYRYVQRGTAGGDPLDDWLQAEEQVDQTLIGPSPDDNGSETPSRSRRRAN